MWDMSSAEETELPCARLHALRTRLADESFQAELARQTCNDRSSGYLSEHRFILLPIIVYCSALGQITSVAQTTADSLQ